MTALEPGLTNALNHVVQSLFRRTEEPVACLFHANRRFWQRFAEVASGHGADVRLVPISPAQAEDPSWVPEPLDKSTCFSSAVGTYRSGCTIIGMPLRSTPGIVEEQTYRRLADLARSAHPTILWEWPVHQVPEDARDAVGKLYLAALSVDYAELGRRNQETAARFPSQSIVRIKAEHGTDVTLRCQAANVYSESCRFGAQQTCFQLPGGEVFAIPDAGSAEGCIGIEIDHTMYEISVAHGVADLSEIANLWTVPKKAPLAEFGIGTNRQAPALKMLNIGEKAAGTCHFGFGDNHQFGGPIRLDYHFDLLMQNPTITWKTAEGLGRS